MSLQKKIIETHRKTLRDEKSHETARRNKENTVLGGKSKFFPVGNYFKYKEIKHIC